MDSRGGTCQSDVALGIRKTRTASACGDLRQMEAWMQVRKQVQRRRVRSRFEGDTDLRLGFDTMQRPFITFSYCHPFVLVVGGTGARGVTGGAMEGVTGGAREGPRDSG